MKGERFQRALTFSVILLALALGVAIYLVGLEATPMQPGNEAMYALPAIRMLETGELLVPHYEHGPFLEKPPLTWWILAASYRIFGVSLFAERLPGALAALGTVLAVALWVRRRSGPLAGLTAALALVYSFKFAALARTSAADTFLTLAVTLAILALDRAARSSAANDLKAGLLCGGALALAFGFKGLIGLVLPVGGVATGLLLDRARPVRVKRRGGIALLVLLAAVAPWHWAMTQRFGSTFWKFFYWDNQLLRGATGMFTGTPRGPLYYVGILALSAFPWTLFVPAAFLSRRGSTPAGWLVFGLLFLSVLTMKREVYLMPLFPAVAAMVGEYLATPEKERSRRRRWLWVTAALVPAGFLPIWSRMGEVLSQLAGHDAYVLLGAALALLLVSLVAAARFDSSGWTVGGVGAACALFFLSFLLIEVRLSRYDPFPRWGRLVARECGENCQGYRVRLAYTSLDYYSRFEWNEVSDPRELSGRLRDKGAYVVLRTSEESLLRGTPARVEIVDRRLWLDENWMTAALHPDRFRLEALLLARVQPIREIVAEVRRHGSAPPP